MNSNIELISYAKLAEHSQARIDLPIRKYVLIANFLRSPKPEQLQQHWFDTCLSQLDQEDEMDDESIPPPVETTSVKLHAYYNFKQKNGFLVYSTNL